MPGRSTHALAGAAVGVGATILLNKLMGVETTLSDLVGGGLLGAFAGITPDLLEPALDPNHRKMFHSVAALGAIAVGNYKVFENPEISQQAKNLVTTMSAGYASHLLLDSGTAKGLPFI